MVNHDGIVVYLEGYCTSTPAAAQSGARRLKERWAGCRA